MAATKAADPTAMSLKGLLDGLLVSHREDIHAYGAGHLNESNLAKPPKHQRSSWPSADISDTAPKKSLSKSKSRRSDPSRQGEMHGTLADFSMGTMGGPPDKSRHEKSMPLTGRSVVNLNRSDTIMIEELNHSELMLEKTKYDVKPFVSDNLNQEAKPGTSTDNPAPMFGWSKDESLLPSKHSFVPSHQGAVTRKDAYDTMMEFQRKVLRKQDTTERHVLTGARAVEELEAQLRSELERLPGNQNGPNFHRLQVYSESFDDLIMRSPTFGYMLGIIKDEYDEFLAALLDSQPDKTRGLYEQVNQLSSRGQSNPHQLATEMQRVRDKEDKARELLEENESLRKLLAEEILLSEQTETEPVYKSQAPSVRRSGSPGDIADQVTDLNQHIWQKMDEIAAIKFELKHQYEPTSVCQQLEHCVKETEVEVQKLTSQTEFYSSNIEELEQDLKTCIEEADTTEQDEKRVWNKIAAMKGAEGTEEDDDDLNDELKWSWYIS